MKIHVHVYSTLAYTCSVQKELKKKKGTQGKWSMNMDFHGVKRVRICTVCTLYARCKSPRKSVVISCKSMVIPRYHYSITTNLHGLTWTFAKCVQCAHCANTDSFEPVEVHIHEPFSLWNPNQYIINIDKPTTYVVYLSQ